MQRGLTPRLAQLLDIIRRHVLAHGFAPSRAQMAAALGIRSHGAVNAMVDRLEERGYVKRTGHGARSLELAAGAGLYSPGVEASIAEYCRVHRVERHAALARAVEHFFGSAA